MTNTAKVQEYKNGLIKKAEELVVNGFPATIVALNNLLETQQFKNRKLQDVHQDLNIPVPDPILLNSHSRSKKSPAKRIKYENSSSDLSSDDSDTKILILSTGSLLSNKHLVALIDNVKPHVQKLVEDFNLMKMWISFMIPKIEDGNNFGVSIQEDILTEVQFVESTAIALFDEILRYFTLRGKWISKVAKYPHIEDYRRAVDELDQNEYFILMLTMSEIRNKYCFLHDIIIKNLDKIKKPRTSNATESLY